METRVTAIEWIVLGSFALVVATGLAGQLLLIKSTDWVTFPSGVSKLRYLAWGIYSSYLVTQHVPARHRPAIFLVRRAFLYLFVTAMMIVVGSFVLQAN